MNNLKPLREGIVRDTDTGLLYLPATRRADGTWRKPIRIKEGYIPQDEMPVFESIGNKFESQKSKGPVGLAPKSLVTSTEGMSKAAKKNLRRKEKKKESNSVQVPSISSFKASPKVDTKKNDIKTGPVKSEDLQRNVDEKRVKALQKKLRQIETLSKDIKSGELAKPDPDQISKIEGKSAVEDELNSLLEKLQL